MRGLAPPDSLTGKVQRALTEEWSTQSEIANRAGLYDYKRPTTLRACLERLVREDRAEWQIDKSQPVVRWRKPAGELAHPNVPRRAPQPPAGDDGNAGTPVAPTPEGER